MFVANRLEGRLMFNLAATPGTGPNTSALPVIRAKSREDAWADLPHDRCLVMGILNVTEDSFSDGGRFLNVDAAIAHGVEMMRAGADIIDVGGESTRPGADFVDPEVEVSRVVPVVKGLVAAGAVVSVDTTHASTARAAWEAGAHLINDVSGQTFEPEMAQVVAELGARVVLTHRRGDQKTMVDHAEYGDVVAEVVSELVEVRDQFVAAGVARENIILDPGVGFAKNAEHDWAVLNAADRFVALGHDVLIGTSRKRFLGRLLEERKRPHEVADRDAATHATSALAAASGAWAVRVHDVSGTRDAVEVARAWVNPAEAVEA